MNEIVTHKKCSTCNEWKLTSEFNKHKTSKGGLRPECRSCMSKKARIYREANLEKERERLRNYRENNKEKERESRRKARERNIDKVRESDRKYRALNLEKVRETVRKWRENNIEKARERNRKWQKDNADKAKAILHRYRTQKAGNGGSFTEKEWQALCMKYDYRCLHCGEQKKLTADHVIPVAKGGTSNIENIQPLCGSCNSSKGIKEIDYRY